MTKDCFAQLVELDRAQMVRLPDEMRLPGTEVRVHRSSGGLVLEPIVKKSPDEIRALELVDRPSLEQMRASLAALDALKHIPFMANGREQPPMPDDDDLPAFGP